MDFSIFIPMDQSWQKGQIILVVVLVMVVGLTIGLALASRSITNLRISTDEKNSQAALSAAEAGIEQAVKKQVNCGASAKCTAVTSPANATVPYLTTVDFQTGSNQTLMRGGQFVTKNEGADIWLVDHNVDGTPNYSSGWSNQSRTLSIYFGPNNQANACANPALEVIVLSNFASPKTTRYVYDPCPLRASGNHFALPTLFASSIPSSVSSTPLTLNYRVQIDIVNGLVVRVVPIYSNAQIGFSGPNLPSQGKIYESVGSADGTKRKVTVYEAWGDLSSEFFQYVYLVPGS